MASGSGINPHIFREYDIRGVAERDLNQTALQILGKAMGTYLRRRGVGRITLGYDCRLSSERLRDQLSAGLTCTGLHVQDIGMCPTPLLYFSLHQLDPGGGIMITGSHNPPEYNGFKIAAGKSTIHGEQIQEIRKIVESGSFDEGEGRRETVSLLPEYQAYLSESLGKLDRPLQVVVDCGNGTAGLVAPQLYRDLGCEVIELYCAVDGSFPNHHPDPTVVDNIQDLIRQVRRTGADLGVAFDGDADRIGAVDDQGNVIWGDSLLILYSRQILSRQPGATIIGEVKCSKNLYDDIEKHGGRGIMWKAGHSLIKAKMKEENAVLAGEMSGHMFFADRYFGYDDAIYAGGRLLELVAGSRETISAMLSDLPETASTPEIRLECPDSHKFEVVKRAQEFFSGSYRTVNVDGVRVLFEDGWGLVRASNTQPALVLRFEAESEKRLIEIKDLIQDKLQEFMAAIVSGDGKQNTINERHG